MQQLTKRQLQDVKRVRNFAFIPFIILVLFHLFMVTYILPLSDGELNIYRASRAGGSTQQMAEGDFLAISLIAITATAVAALLIFLLAHFKKRRLVFVLGFILFGASSYYLYIYLTYALGMLWGTAGQVVGFIVPILIWAALIWPIAASESVKPQYPPR